MTHAELYFIINFDFFLIVEFKSKCKTCLNITDGPFGNETFSFNQLHFHWGSKINQGSEHCIDGKFSPMEIHLVHFNTNLGKTNNIRFNQVILVNKKN